MERLVHGRAGQVVHGCIDDAEVLLLAGLEVQHFGEADAGVAHQRTAGFNHQLAVAKTTRVEFGQQPRPQGIGLGWHVAVVVDAQSAAKVDVVDGHPCGFNRFDQVQDAVHRVEVRGFFGDL